MTMAAITLLLGVIEEVVEREVVEREIVGTMQADSG